ncbi:MAG TPA: hypothetical protein VF815_46240, partial [Myxococcaceae bacterium]
MDEAHLGEEEVAPVVHSIPDFSMRLCALRRAFCAGAGRPPLWKFTGLCLASALLAACASS